MTQIRTTAPDFRPCEKFRTSLMGYLFGADVRWSAKSGGILGGLPGLLEEVAVGGLAAAARAALKLEQVVVCEKSDVIVPYTRLNTDEASAGNGCMDGKRKEDGRLRKERIGGDCGRNGTERDGTGRNACKPRTKPKRGPRGRGR